MAGHALRRCVVETRGAALPRLRRVRFRVSRPAIASTSWTNPTASTSGTRRRNWDACQTALFTLHGSGHNPRKDQTARFRQRIMHKFSIYPARFGEVLCTGCGRCVRVCAAGMDLVCDTRGDRSRERRGGRRDMNLYQPHLVRIEEMVDETIDTRTFKLSFEDAAVAEKFDFKAGQFGEYSVFGAGECTFCIASPPTRKGIHRGELQGWWARSPGPCGG